MPPDASPITLPNCDDLFQRFFDPWYNEASRKRRPFKGTYPDIMQSDKLVGYSQVQASRINSKGQEQVLAQIASMVNAARGDMSTYLKVEGDLDLSWIDAFDRYADRSNVRDLIEQADPTNFSNRYIVITCAFGAALSHVLRMGQPRLVWRLDWPYWDSCLFDPKTGTVVSVFHWAIKKMSEYGVDDGFAAKTKACLQFLEKEGKLGN